LNNLVNSITQFGKRSSICLSDVDNLNLSTAEKEIILYKYFHPIE